MKLDYFLIFLSAFLGMWPSMFILSLISFRQKINGNITTIVTSSFVMSLVSLLLQTLPIQYAITILQPIFFTLCLFLLFRFSFFYSLLTSVFIYIFAILVEVVVTLIISNFNLNKFIVISQNEFVSPALIIATVNYLLSFVLYKYRLGFSFIPAHSKKGIQAPFTKHWIYLMIFGYMLVFGSCLALFHWSQLMIIILALIGILFVFLVHIFITKDLEAV